MRVLASLPLLAMAALQVAAGDFSATCSGTSYFSTSVKSYCMDKYQEDSYSTDLDMTKCLANVGGRIVCRPSNPSFKFCDCGLGGDKKQILNCRCTDSTGAKRPSSLNLDTCLSNIDGDLKC
ncbi:uncharacterized protein CCOS01_03488 [Colletotrichum costaricense]|uniref:Cyanovirin-N domain-containing protein n=1 Tax=Colletotrichum costaricense TaxID=1209916 RepID=A0AAI9Z6Q3_9PEZI|nr:uncharacterized protein CCOS01_03488 [Colletotrichum costaricense]KAK1534736.1 hypothetical protein CCOS01_03488 [Colletotrichum costaricense]